jgi:uncharacterized protein (TIGR03905 family)
MRVEYNTQGTCCRVIRFDIDESNKTITNVEFYGGCNGNLKMIAKLVDGMTADEIISKCRGNLCGNKNTSCADQLACGVEAAVNELS